LRGAKVCLVGSTIVRELFDGEDPVGKELRIQSVVFKVIGVLKSKGANMMGMDQDDTVIASWTTVKMRLRGAGSTSLSSTSSTSSSTSATSTSALYVGSLSLYPSSSSSSRPPVRFANVDSLIIAAPSQKEVAEAVEEVTETLRETHRLAPEDDDDFRIRTMAEFSEIFTSQTETMTNLLICVALVSLLVGGIGIMNIMLVSVTERTREIGLRMAVGARGGDILKQFLVESIVICMLGGLLGIAVGHGLSVLMTVLMNWPSSISYGAIILAVGVSAAVGVVFGYYPAWKAARLDPIEALRYE
ncbi:MAG: FtsX-like permease family protein, partial [Opitutales bacterium]|nr:FtsX-like permease family protein [Opitutales bacterium]